MDRLERQLCERALVALEEAIQLSRADDYRPDRAVHFALAFLWSRRRGRADPYRLFWAALSEHKPWSLGTADRALEDIYRQVGITREEEMYMTMWRRVIEEGTLAASGDLVTRRQP